ncbi:MAG: alanine/ornithine racemase family PLP-dependent enzyme [Caldisericia bacterium]|nr:alanine/ornithine racemase family PLP-dependent enzyme [Caldisericia bacterium]
MNTPILSINIEKLTHNLSVVNSLCVKSNVKLTPVTKVIMGDPVICSKYAEITSSLADSRVSDIVRMKNHSINAEFMLIRSPSLQNIDQVVDICDISLNTEINVLSALNDYCIKTKTTHKVILMVEIGDLREGIMIDDFPRFLELCTKLKALDFVGVGCNATCFAGLIPTVDNLKTLQAAAEYFKKYFHKHPEYISGGGSNLMPLLENSSLPSFINHVRVGETIVMGVDAINKNSVGDCYQDCFTLTGEIIELKIKPTLPKKPLTKNAFGETPFFEDKGLRKRAIVNIGRLDTDIFGLTPTLNGLSILGASSDHLLLDVEESSTNLNVGDTISFRLNYSALLYSMSSEYVHKKYIKCQQDS